MYLNLSIKLKFSMKSFSFLFSLLLGVLQLNSQSLPTTEAWRADLQFLKETIHSDYPFLFKKITAAEFDKACELLDKAIPNMQPHEVILGLSELISLFKYGHTDLDWNGVIKFSRAPLNLYWFSDGVFIEGIHKDYADLVGAKVLKVEGVDIQTVFKAVIPIMPAENDQFFKAHGIGLVCHPEVLHARGITKTLKSDVTFLLELNGKVLEKTIPAKLDIEMPRQYGNIHPNESWVSMRNQADTPLYLKNLDKIYYFEYLPEHKTVYVRHSQIQDDPTEPIPAFYDRLFKFIEENEVERLVLDVRLNGGGNNYKNKDVVTRILRSRINEVGKFFVILGRRTFSACQNLVNELDNYTEVIFLGEPTGENINFYGDNRQVELPNSKLKAYLSFAWWQDKPQWENGPWMAPHIALEMTSQDYKSNHDPILDVALNFEDKDFIRQPLRYFEMLFSTGQMEKLQSESVRLVNDPRYKFFDFEGQFDRAGRDIMGRGAYDMAIMILQFNINLFPKSANAWKSIGEAYWKAGQKENAISSLRKAMELDPNGKIGAGAKTILETLQKVEK